MKEDQTFLFVFKKDSMKKYDSVIAVDDEVDFSKYDFDGDGTVDTVYFIYAGYGQADTGDETTVWPHQSVLQGMIGTKKLLDGVYVNNVGFELASSVTTNLAENNLTAFKDYFGLTIHQYQLMQTTSNIQVIQMEYCII